MMMTIEELIEAFRNRGDEVVFDDSHPEALKITIADEVLYVQKHLDDRGAVHIDSQEVRDRLRSCYERRLLER